MVFCPELLMRNILGEIHYMPSHWKGHAHTYKVKNEFAALFQYKAVSVSDNILKIFSIVWFMLLSVVIEYPSINFLLRFAFLNNWRKILRENHKS